MLSFLAERLSAQGRLIRNLIKNPKFWIILGIDILLLALAHYLAYAIRFESILRTPQLHQFAGLLPLILTIKIILFYIAGLYRGMWHYTSLPDDINIFFVSLISSLTNVSL